MEHIFVSQIVIFYIIFIFVTVAVNCWRFVIPR